MSGTAGPVTRFRFNTIAAVGTPGPPGSAGPAGGDGPPGPPGTPPVPTFFSALATLAPSAPRQAAYLDGYAAVNDGGGGLFMWNATDTTAADGGTVVQVTGWSVGRWNRVVDGALNAKWFGAKGDGSTDDHAALTAAVASRAAGVLHFQAGTYVIGSNLTVPRGWSVTFDEGATLSPSGGVTLTILGRIKAHETQQVFSNTATVALYDQTSTAGSMMNTVYAAWWGAVGDWNGGTSGTDNTSALQKSLAAAASVGRHALGGNGGKLIIGRGSFRFTDSLTLDSANQEWGVIIEGQLAGTSGAGFDTNLVMDFTPELSGTTASIDGSGNLTGISGLVAADVGQFVFLTNVATATNFGVFQIMSISGGGTAAVLADPIGVFGPASFFPMTSDANNGSIHWTCPKRNAINIFTRDCTVRNLAIGPADGRIVKGAISDTQSPTDTTISTDNTFENILISPFGRSGAYLLLGFTHADKIAPRAGYPTNCENGRWERCQALDCEFACFYDPNGTGQSKALTFEQCGFLNAEIYGGWGSPRGHTAFYKIWGSFDLHGGSVGYASYAFATAVSVERATVQDLDSEGSSVLFAHVTGDAGGGGSTTFIGGRINMANLQTSGYAMVMQGSGSLTMIGTVFDTAPHLPTFKILGANGTYTFSSAFIGCNFPSPAPINIAPASGHSMKLTLLGCTSSKSDDSGERIPIADIVSANFYGSGGYSESAHAATLLTAGPITINTTTSPGTIVISKTFTPQRTGRVRVRVRVAGTNGTGSAMTMSVVVSRTAGPGMADAQGSPLTIPASGVAEGSLLMEYGTDFSVAATALTIGTAVQFNAAVVSSGVSGLTVDNGDADMTVEELS